MRQIKQSCTPDTQTSYEIEEEINNMSMLPAPGSCTNEKEVIYGI